MSTKSIAESYFIRIGDGHRNAISRPNINSPRGRSIDRVLRAMIERANNNGDCIINAGSGICRPMPGDPLDESEYKEYIAKEMSRKQSIEAKIYVMHEAYAARKKEIEYGEQQAERKAGRAGTGEHPAQLRLPGV